jgi:ubiquinone biosynthesis protein
LGHDSRKRYQEIAGVLVHHGFEWLWSKWGIGKVLGNFEAAHGGHPAINRGEPERLRLAFERLGTTFIKLGQMLSTRPDLLPPDYIAELSKLQDDAPKVPYDQIAAIIETEFGKPPEEVFASFDPDPRGAGSVAQVHSAVLADGAHVVVKVRRPGIEHQVDQDLAILGQLARFAATNTEFGKTHNIEGLVDEFGFTLRNELDFTREGQNAERIAAQFKGDPSLHVPTIFWPLSTHQVLTMEEVQGIKIDDLDALDAAGVDRVVLAKRCANLALVQVFDFGFFHADPHPGNFFISGDGVIGLIDYGMVGRLGDRLRASLLRLSMAVTRHDSERVIDELLDMGAARNAVDRHALARDLDQTFARYDGLPLGSMSAAQIFRDIMAIAQRHVLALPSELVVLARVIAMDEGMGAHLDPNFNLIEFAKPYFKRFWLKNHSFQATAERAKESVIDLADYMADLPERLVRLSGMVERGEISVSSRVQVPDSLVKRLEQAANRISISVLSAGILIGLSVIALVYRPAGDAGVVVFAVRALLAAGVLCGIWLAAAFWKSLR